LLQMNFQTSLVAQDQAQDAPAGAPQFPHIGN
jgi:hypothetical protein